MKRIIMAVILFAFLASAAACSKKDEAKEAAPDQANSPAVTEGTGTEAEVAKTEAESKDSEGEAKETTEPNNAEEAVSDAVVNTEGETGEADLTELSKELALQMVKGDFDQTHQLFSPMVKLQLTKNSLKSSWDTTVADLGDYKEIYSAEQMTEGAYQNIIIVLKYENNGLKITFTYNDKGKIDGLWMNYATAGMKLETTDVYAEQAIRIGEGGDYPVDGILTLPNGATKPPVLILVPGSGTHDWDESIGSGVNKPFRDIAHGLAEQGIATIRYQERLAAYPELASERVTIQLDSLDDVNAAIAFATGCDQIDTGRIYVLGHSLGGMLAPKIAADHKEVKGILCLAGSPRKLEDIVIDQQELFGNGDKKVMDEVRKQAKEVKGLTEESAGDYLGMPASYWYSLNLIDTPEILKTLTVPMFIAQGSADLQVYADRDYTAWQELLKDRKDVTFKLYDNLNHLFMASNGEKDLSEYLIPSSVDRQVIEDMAAWINEN